ncbi:MAG: hypothetical protein ABI586_02165 [Candidatus Nanopelagicales bacterium]
MNRFGTVSSAIGLMGCVALTALLIGPAATAAPTSPSQHAVDAGLDVHVLSTADNKIYDRGSNQGWWSDRTRGRNRNDNYIVGKCCHAHYRDFFTFDLSQIGRHVVRADLRVFSASIKGGPFDFGLFDVSTSAAAVNHNVGRNLAIFEDLGTGDSYGTYEISRDQQHEWLNLRLNHAAISDMNDSLGKYFTLGGSMLTPTSGRHGQYLFASSQKWNARLVVRTTPH